LNAIINNHESSLLDFFHEGVPIGFSHLLQKDMVDFVSYVDLLGLAENAGAASIEGLVEAWQRAAVGTAVA